jgi:hypothetical protein
MMKDRVSAPLYFGAHLARKVVVGLSVAMLLAPQRVFATSYETDQQRAWLPTSRSDAFTGEITFEFDSVLNQTTATFVAPLGKRDLLHRIFAQPTVHTIVVSYRFSGRTASHVPDTIRVQLESDDYVDSLTLNRFHAWTDPTLSVGVGNHVEQHPVSVSERIESEAQPRGLAENTAVAPDRQWFVRTPSMQQARIRRRATASFPGCDFLSMIDQTEIRGTVGGLEFNLSPSVVAGLQRFAAEMLAADRQLFIECAQ